MLRSTSQTIFRKIRRYIWHGKMLPAPMDGVPGLTFPGIKPGETFTYRFPVRQGRDLLVSQP